VLRCVWRAHAGKPFDFEAEMAAHVDLVSSLLEAAQRDDEHAYATAVVLPDDASFEELAIAAWERFSDMAVAGVAYHF
jgi:hypothetical protein